MQEVIFVFKVNQYCLMLRYIVCETVVDSRKVINLCERFFFFLVSRASLVAQRLKRLPPMWETWVQSLGREGPLEKEMATHSIFSPGESHGLRSLVGCSPQGHKESDTTE